MLGSLCVSAAVTSLQPNHLLAECSKLDTLTLDAYDQVTNEMLDVLRRHRSLTKLSLRSCYHVTDKGFVLLAGVWVSCCYEVHPLSRVMILPVWKMQTRVLHISFLLIVCRFATHEPVPGADAAHGQGTGGHTVTHGPERTAP